jgi:hypothetical protein
MSSSVISCSIPVNLEDSEVEDLRNDITPPVLALHHMLPSHLLDSRNTSRLFRPFYSHFHVHLVGQVLNSTPPFSPSFNGHVPARSSGMLLIQEKRMPFGGGGGGVARK